MQQLNNETPYAYVRFEKTKKQKNNESKMKTSVPKME